MVDYWVVKMVDLMGTQKVVKMVSVMVDDWVEYLELTKDLMKDPHLVDLTVELKVLKTVEKSGTWMVE